MRRTKKGRAAQKIAFASVLRSLMEERSLTITQIASLAGVGKSVAHDWLNGTNPHDLNAVGKLATALGISFRSLILGEPDSLEPHQSIHEIFEEQEFFEGYCKISIKKLDLKTSKKPEVPC